MPARSGGEAPVADASGHQQQAAPSGELAQLPDLPPPPAAVLQPQPSQQAPVDLDPSLDLQQPFLDPPTALDQQLRPLQPPPLPHQLQQCARQGTPQPQRLSPQPQQQPSQQQQQQQQHQQQPLMPPVPASGRPEASRSLYVGKLHPHVNEAMLLEIFSTLGAVQEVKVIRDKLTSLSAGYGFITYYDPRY